MINKKYLGLSLEPSDNVRGLIRRAGAIAALTPLFWLPPTRSSAEETEVPSVLGSYHSGIFDESASEIVAFDTETQRLFVVNSNSSQVDIIDASDTSQPTLLTSRTFEGGGINSVAVKNGIVAIAIENEDKQANGSIALMNADGYLYSTLEAGALPDALTFTPDGTKVVVANEGEPNDEYTIDPEGSVTIIDLLVNGTINPSRATATQVTFESFNNQLASLRNKGVRISGPNATVAQDLEPEYVAASEDGTTAYVSLQENNAIAVVDLESYTTTDILALGYKDHSRGFAELEEYVFDEDDLPVLGISTADDETPVLLGGMSGLWHEVGESDEDTLVFYAVPDRGPNGSAISVDGLTNREFLIPDYQSRVVRFELDTPSGELSITNQILLTRKDGTTPITGIPNIPGYDEVPLNGKSEPIDYDPYGADMEGIVINPIDGTFWTVDEYRPAIYNFASNGTLIERYVPEGTSLLGDSAQAEGYYGAETLPAEYSKRRANRGFEAVALDTDNNIVYAFIQTPLYNPDNSTQNTSDVIRILGIDPTNGTPVAEYVYLLERNTHSGHSLARTDKIGDAVYAGKGRFYVLERDSSDKIDGTVGHKYIFEFDLKGATNLLAGEAPSLMLDKTLEQHTAEDLAAQGIQTVYKTKITNLPSIGYIPTDKPEGLTLLADGSIALISDNDFTQGGFSEVSLGIISFAENDNQLDVSNEDGGINISNWPIYGLFMPDSIATYQVDGFDYIVTANEGDGRDYDGFSDEDRVADLILDPDEFPEAEFLQLEENLGRLKTPNTEGDIDGDGDIDRIFSFGARSFTIFDTYGNLVFDSGDDFEKTIATEYPDYFNSSNDKTELDNRSDDKGPEPEAIVLGKIDGHTYAFIGIERFGGIFVYDITDPSNSEYVTYFNNRDFEADPETKEAGDLGPEGIIFISSVESPNRKPLLVVASEVSGSTTILDLSEVIGTKIIAPTGTAAERQANGEIKISWVDESDNEDGFVIERSENGASWKEIGRVFIGSTQFIDREIENFKDYKYRTFSISGDTYSEPSTIPEAIDTTPIRSTIYFGEFEGGTGEFSFFVRDSGTAVFVGYNHQSKTSIFNLAIDINEDGSFEFSNETSNLVIIDGPTMESTVNISGDVNGIEISGTATGILPTPLTFSGIASAETGHTEAFAGFYQGVVTESNDGVLYQIIAPDGKAFLYLSNGEFVDGGIGVAGTDGAVLSSTESGTIFDLLSNSETGLFLGTVRNTELLNVSVIGFNEGEGGKERLVNSSTRGSITNDESVIIAGFVIEGSENADILIRGVGPALEHQGITGFLEDPVIKLFKDNEMVGQNDNWITHPNFGNLQETINQVGAFTFTKTTKDSTLLANLEPGAYTVHLSEKNGDLGVGLVEIYDASPEGVDAELINLSTRGHVDKGTGVMILGLVVTGEIPQKVLIQAVGSGMGDMLRHLEDPHLSLYSGQTRLASNDNWGDNANDIYGIGTNLGATQLDEKDAALLVWLEPGAYTMIVSGVKGTTGTALIETYQVD